MIELWIARLVAWVSKRLVLLGSILAGVAFLIMGHKYKVHKANKEGEETGREREQARVVIETEVKTRQIKEKADEIIQEVDRGTADLDDLRKRMRSSASDSGNQ